jgi:hypothetical protein
VNGKKCESCHHEHKGRTLRPHGGGHRSPRPTGRTVRSRWSSHIRRYRARAATPAVTRRGKPRSRGSSRTATPPGNATRTRCTGARSGTRA